jgi:hypothetical protein
MATSGSFYTNVGSGWRLQMEWELNSQSIENNTSSITARLYWMSLGSAYTVSSTATKTCGIQYNDGSWDNYSAAGLAALSGNQKKLIHSKTFTINHNADGTGSFNLDGYFKAEVTLSGTYYGTVDLAQKSYTLPTIPRASTPSLSASSINMDSAVTIYTNRASTSFTHTLSYVFGSASGTIATGVGASYSWTVPLSLANQIPNATSGSGTITCKTYSGGTLVGTKTISFTAVVPSSVIPTTPSLSHSELNSLITNAAIGAYVNGMSNIRLTASGSSGAYGSTIVQYRIVYMGSTYYVSTKDTGTINWTSSGTIYAYAKDSRGRWSNAKTISLTALPYATPKITAFNVYRSTSDGTPDAMGTYVKSEIAATISSLNSKNQLIYKVYSKARGTSTWTLKESGTLSVGTTSLNTSHVESTYEQTTSYDFKFEVIDLFNTASLQQIVSTSAVPMSLSETGVGIGKMHENGALDIEGDVYINGIQGYIIEHGSNSNGYYIKYADGTMICRREIKNSAASPTRDLGLVPYPSGFYAPPTVSVVKSEQDTQTWAGVVHVGIKSTTSVRVVMLGASSSVKYTFNIIAIGRWKA